MEFAELVKPFAEYGVIAIVLAVMFWWMIRERRLDRIEAASRELRLGERLDKVEDEYRGAVMSVLVENARAMSLTAEALKENSAVGIRLVAVIEKLEQRQSERR